MEQAPAGPQTPSARARGFSFRSDHSGASRPKEEAESPREKQRKSQLWIGGSKANPNAALTENTPAVNAILEENTLSSLRTQQHKDVYGNPITDPDLSNPTRPRMERPLDTIRSFEAAIDSGYKRRSNYMRSESHDQSSGHGQSRRNSAYGFNGTLPNRHANGNGGGYYGNSHGPGSARPPFGAPRMQSEPNMPRPYPPLHGHQASQDTMATGVTNGSDSTGPWANSTDPSSENSSIDKNYPQNGHGPNAYPQNGYSAGPSGPIPEDGAYPMRYGGAVQPPDGARRPIALGNSGSSDQMPMGGSLPSQKRPEAEKKKGRLSRMFSKKGKD